MILPDSATLQAIAEGTIVIDPFNWDCLGTNSYDVHLGKNLAIYRERVRDAKVHNRVEHLEIPEGGFVLESDVHSHWGFRPKRPGNVQDAEVVDEPNSEPEPEGPGGEDLNEH